MDPAKTKIAAQKVLRKAATQNRRKACGVGGEKAHSRDKKRRNLPVFRRRLYTQRGTASQRYLVFFNVSIHQPPSRRFLQSTRTNWGADDVIHGGRGLYLRRLNYPKRWPALIKRTQDTGARFFDSHCPYLPSDSPPPPSPRYTHFIILRITSRWEMTGRPAQKLRAIPTGGRVYRRSPSVP